MSSHGDSRSRILRAAEGVFAEKGFHLATVDEIAERAGVAKGTVFYNFDSKASLFETVLRGGMQYLITAMRREVETARPPLEQIASIVELHVTALLANPGFIAIFSHELSSGLDEGVRRTIQHTREEHVAFVASLLEEAVRNGIVKPLDSAMLASTFFDLALSVCAHAVSRKGQIDARKAAGFLKTLMIEGIVRR